MDVPFSKYNGCGNDFILIDNRSLFFPSHHSTFIQQLCHRQRGIGADGLILLESANHATFSMRIFNSDGKEAEMCGNGIRCLVKYAQEIGFPRPPYTIQTMYNALSADLVDSDVTIEMGTPLEIEWSKHLVIDGESLTLHWLDTGVPHVVLFVDNLFDVKWMKIAPKIRFHPAFSPKGVNVNFATHTSNCIEVRTYERGVEAETLACGTGVTAVALAAAKLAGIPKTVPPIKTRSGDLLFVTYHSSLPFQHVKLTGPAVRSFTGFFKLP